MIDEDLKYLRQERIKEVFFTTLFVISLIGLILFNIKRNSVYQVERLQNPSTKEIEKIEFVQNVEDSNQS